MKLRVDVKNKKKVVRRLKEEGQNISNGSEQGLRGAIIFLQGKMIEVTPVGDTGNLIGSYTRGVKQSRDTIVGWIRNSADYAVYVHEMPAGTNFRKPGATNKFMERPMLENRREIMRLIQGGAQR